MGPQSKPHRLRNPQAAQAGSLSLSRGDKGAHQSKPLAQESYGLGPRVVGPRVFLTDHQTEQRTSVGLISNAHAMALACTFTVAMRSNLPQEMPIALMAPMMLIIPTKPQ